ncbi:restriction endonuclease subunit S [Streptococcus canis]|uniref:restriction endonuclease subunit S n=1 Tax=Streptococcus canis TaxID=1329 RepID=UPI00298E0B14|nr:restriction endonuclease subunit S [Streptococcus canis]MDW7797141.1 restriction endonuclease subunit S [Streptococcus canis]MDW7799481.1 restriction endonuclease subunit S [Streptococcus canis]
MVNYPRDWEETVIGQIGIINMCKRIFSFQTIKNGKIPFYKIGTFGKKADTYISEDLFNLYKKMYPYPGEGDTLISASGSIGKVVIYDGEKSYYQDSNIIWINTNSKKIDKRFFYYYLLSFPWKQTEGTTIKRLYNNIILKTQINLPSMKEQKAIAKTLMAFDEHIENLEELIAKKKMLRDGAVEDLMSGKTRLDGFEGEWKNVQFQNVITPKARIGWQGLKKDEYLKKGFAYLISGTDFENGSISLNEISYVNKERYSMDANIQVKEGDVLVTKDGTIGKIARVPELNKKATLNSGVFVFRTNHLLKECFLYWILRSSIFAKFIDDLSAGSTIKHLYQKDLKNFSFTMPVEIKEQKAIADILTAMDEEIEDLIQEKEKIEKIKAGAMEDLLTGKIRLLKEA